MTGSAPRLWDLTDAEIELDGGPTLLLRLTSVMLSRMSAFELFYFNLCGGVVGVYQRSLRNFFTCTVGRRMPRRGRSFKHQRIVVVLSMQECGDLKCKVSIATLVVAFPHPAMMRISRILPNPSGLPRPPARRSDQQAPGHGNSSAQQRTDHSDPTRSYDQGPEYRQALPQTRSFPCRAVVR